MSKHTKPAHVRPANDFDAWIAEADEKAAAAVAEGVRLDSGTVIDADPRLHYAICDGEAPKKTIERFCIKQERIGRRRIEGASVVGYNSAIVYAMPLEVYAKHIGPRRLAIHRELAARYPKQVATYGPQVL